MKKPATLADILRPITDGLPVVGKPLIVKRGSLHNKKPIRHIYAAAHLVRHSDNYHEFINAFTCAQIKGVTHWAYCE